MSSYEATVHWTRAETDLGDGRVSRGHSWHFDGGVTVPASAAPQVLPPPLSVAEAVDPEEAFVAALSSCHMLFYLWLAEKQGFVVADYRDAAIGYLEKNDQGRLAMTRVSLRPRIAYAGDKRPTPDQERALHDEAHHRCFIANSVTSEITVEPAAPSAR